MDCEFFFFAGAIEDAKTTNVNSVEKLTGWVE